MLCHNFNWYGTVSSLKRTTNPVVINNTLSSKVGDTNSPGKARLLIYVNKEIMSEQVYED